MQTNTCCYWSLVEPIQMDILALMTSTGHKPELYLLDSAILLSTSCVNMPV